MPGSPEEGLPSSTQFQFAGTLDEAGTLLCYAAEAGIDVDNEISKPIVDAILNRDHF